ncbi:hypothetical protein LCGC14_2787610, partial [marine sediment metagenome]
VNITGDLNVVGNFTGNQVYGEMHFHSDQATGHAIIINTQQVYVNITGFNGTPADIDMHKVFTNGFTFINESNALRFIATLEGIPDTKIQDLIMDKITDPELNVTSLCREIGVSSSMLYRKLTRITGKSPVEFIRFIRLQNAARQMVKEDVNVSEAAYQNGFNDLSYFSKSFKNQFGSTPKQFIKDKSGIK